MALSDHAAVELGIDINNGTELRGRWRLNASLLYNEAFNLSLKEELHFFLIKYRQHRQEINRMASV